VSGERRAGAGSSRGGPSGAPGRRQRPPYRGDKAIARAGSTGSSGSSMLLIAGSMAALVIGVAVIGLAYVATRPGPTAAGDTSIHQPAVLTPADIPQSGTTLGQSNAPVTIDLWGDFRCSACYKFSVSLGTEQKLVDNFVRTGKAKLVWHDFTTIDRFDGSTASRDAANAALCAADQGRFWTMHDWLYANQIGEDASAFTTERLLAIGEAAGLNSSAFRTCVTSGAHDADIATEMRNAPSGLTGTPTVYVNGKEIDPGYVPSYDNVAAAIEAALK
jgi:protein-disulfide isomerase